MTVTIPRRPIDSLRKARVLDALGLASQIGAEQRDRDVLLPILSFALGEESILGDGQRLDLVVEAAISVAFSRANESVLDRLAVVALTAQFLAGAGEFARLDSLRPALISIATSISIERPFLAAVLLAFSHHVIGNEHTAADVLRSSLGLSHDKPDVARKTTEQIIDVLLANGFRHWLATSDASRLVDASSVARDGGHATAYEVGELLLQYVDADQRFGLERIVTANAPIFAEDPALSRYLRALQTKRLFPAQVAAVEHGVLNPKSCVLALPTSGGKTLLAELRIMADLSRDPHGKAVYLAPYKTVARQVNRKLSESLRFIGRTVRDLGADFDVVRTAAALAEGLPDVAVMTPERFDSLLRLATTDRPGANEANQFLNDLVLVVLDEVQTLGRIGRGPRMELIIVRLRQRLERVPLVCMTGVIDTTSQLASWLGNVEVASSNHRPTGTIEVLWTQTGDLVQRTPSGRAIIASIARADTASRDGAAIAAMFRSQYWPILVLETTKDLAEKCVRTAMESDPRAIDRFRASLPAERIARLNLVAEDARIALGEQSELPRMIQGGLAYHHAGLPSHLLRQIEGLASERCLRIVATTTTVAEGAHLPFQVVIIPHLNFGGSDEISAELYRNIAGRAGRAGVAHEGIVVIVGSPAPRLQRHVTQTLWTNSPIRLLGQLGELSETARTLRGFASYRDVEGQVLAWIGEQGSEVEDQAETLARSTLSWETTRADRRPAVVNTIGRILASLEQRELVVANSPYRLTRTGKQARLAGLSPSTCRRISQLAAQPNSPFLFHELEFASSLSVQTAELLARSAFQSLELLECSLWLRRINAQERVRVEILREIGSGYRAWPLDEELFRTDVALLAAWIRGASFPELAERAPSFPRGLFADAELSARTGDAADYIGEISSKAGWVWSGIAVMLGDRFPAIPSWIRRGIESGVFTETAVELMSRADVSRFGALALGANLPSDWNRAKAQLLEMSSSDSEQIGLSQADVLRLRAWRNTQS